MANGLLSPDAMDLEASLESLRETLSKDAPKEQLRKFWYCEACGVVIPLGLRCRFCGRVET